MDSSMKNRLLSLLNSRKVLTALAAVLAIVLARVGLDVPQETVMTIAALAIALIFAIAGEDMAQKAGSDVAAKQIDKYLNERDLSEAEVVRLEGELATLRKEKDELVREYNKRADERDILRRERDRYKSVLELQDHLIQTPPAADAAAVDENGGAASG